MRGYKDEKEVEGPKPFAAALRAKYPVSNFINGRSTMNTTYTHILNLAKETEPPADGILSRTVFQDDRLKAVAFGFGQGQELSEHTSSKPAILFFVKGEAILGLGDDVQEAQAGTWVHMPAGLKHSIKAKTPVVMLLVLLT
jgi:quercetin dioxygenase-like cupin family protein